MKISSGWKIIFYIFALLGLFQVYEIGFTLMNKPDSFIANAGLIMFAANIGASIYCFFQLIKNATLYIREVEEGKEVKK